MVRKSADSQKAKLLNDNLKKVIIVIILLGLGSYFIPNKIIKNNQNHEKNDSSTKTVTDNIGNKYFLKLQTGKLCKYELVNEADITVWTWEELALVFDKNGKCTLDSLVFNIYHLASQTPDFSYLALEFDISTLYYDHQYHLIGINNQEAKPILNIGGRGTSVYKAYKGPDGDLQPTDDYELDNYIIKDNTVSFYYTGCDNIFDIKLDLEKEPYPFLKLTLLGDSYTTQKINVDYKVGGAGVGCS